MFSNLFRDDSGVLLEETPAGDQSIELTLPEPAAECLAALLALESFPISRALGELFLAGCREAHRASRRVPAPPQPTCAPGSGSPSRATAPRRSRWT
jgi:hypothetical protein